MSNSEPAVFATQRQPLEKQIVTLLQSVNPETVEGEILALVVPKTNLLSAAPIAAELYKMLEGRQYDTVVLIAPSQTGAFRRMNICSVNAYSTPLGDLPINDRVRNELCDEDDDIFIDDSGHYHTEGVDVQLPYLQKVLEGFDVIPIVMGDESPEFCRELAHAVSEVMYNRRTLIVAIADIVEGTEDALNDLKNDVELLDDSRLMSLLNSETVRLEGKGPVIVAMCAAKQRRAGYARVTQIRKPEGDTPGSIGAVIWRL